MRDLPVRLALNIVNFPPPFVGKAPMFAGNGEFWSKHPPEEYD
jgi:hypothetical protein